MYRSLRHTAFGALILTIFILSGLSSAHSETGMEMLSEYLDLVITGNYESAYGFWLEENQNRSQRFGIEYIDVPLKIDCASPIVRFPELLHGNNEQPISTETKLAWSEALRYTIEVRSDWEKMKHYYHIKTDGDYYWLTFPQDLYGQDWPITETKYFRIHVHPEVEKYLNPIVLNAADEFFETTARSMGISDDDLRHAVKEKVEYFYCHSDNMVRDIIGHMVKGTYDLASDDIISAFFPHYHEITHFLVNYRLKRLPLYSLPLVREGAAVYYGGRWGKSTSSLFTLGGHIYKEGIVELEKMLTMVDFDKGTGADLGYPTAGMMAAYIIENQGEDVFFDLYLKLSGDFDTLYAMSPETIQQTIVETLGAESWDKLKLNFDAYVEQWLDESTGMYPGNLEGGETVFQSQGVIVTRDGDWMSLTAVYEPDAPLTGNLLFGRDDKLNGRASSLLEQQYKSDVSFEGFRYGIRWDRNEAGVYDYATNELVAKYIFGMAPSEDYYNETENKVSFMFESKLVGGEVPAEGDFKLLAD